MFIFSNLATSLDGKIATATREHFSLGSKFDQKMMQILRKRSDIVILGASTLRAHQHPASLVKQGFFSKTQPANAVVSSTLEGVLPSFPFFKEPNIKRILFVGPRAKASSLRKFEKSCEIIRLKPGKTSSLQIVSALEKRGYKKLLVEGGGGLMWDFASENLIDEYYVTLTPRILGGVDAPTLVDGEGFSRNESLNLRLVRAKKMGDEIYLVYRKTERRGL